MQSWLISRTNPTKTFVSGEWSPGRTRPRATLKRGDVKSRWENRPCQAIGSGSAPRPLRRPDPAARATARGPETRASGPQRGAGEAATVGSAVSCSTPSGSSAICTIRSCSSASSNSRVLIASVVAVAAKDRSRAASRRWWRRKSVHHVRERVPGVSHPVRGLTLGSSSRKVNFLSAR
jgi:hypothetical protein